MRSATIYVPADKAHDLQKLLDKGEYFVGAPELEAIETFTALLDDGYEVDVRVWNGDGPYIDAVLFRNGNEVSCHEVMETLVGTYRFPQHSVEVEVART